jgi:TIR domain
MPYDVFISHSSSDKLVAEAVCSRLESAGVRCWVAPRNINPGEGWSTAILRGIEACRLMVLVFSDHSNHSAHVRREVAHACDHELIVIPLRIRDAIPRGDLQYYLNELHWLDALTPPLEKHLETLTARVTHLLSGDHVTPAETSVPKSKPLPVRRRLSPLVLLIALSAIALVVSLATISLWIFSTHNVSQTLASPATEAVESGTPIPEIMLRDGTRVSVAKQEVLLNDADLGLRAMPMAGIAMIENGPGRVRLLLGAGNKTYLLEGPDLGHLNALPRLVLEPGEPGTFDNGAANVFAVVKSGSIFYSFYQASDSEGVSGTTVAGYSGFYLSIGLAESDDDGYTWVKKGQIIKCAKPKEWAATPKQGGRGIGWAGGLADTSGKHFYVYYTDLSTPHTPVGQINVARCSLDDGPPLPGNWKKYYNGAFTEPGIGGQDSPIIDLYAAGQSGAWYGRPTYAKFMGKYIMVFEVNQPREWEAGVAPQISGIYLAVSDDLIKWSERFKLLSSYAQRILGKSIVVAPTIVFDQDDKASGWLTYGYSPKYTSEALLNLGTPTYLVGRRITFEKANR